MMILSRKRNISPKMAQFFTIDNVKKHESDEELVNWILNGIVSEDDPYATLEKIESAQASATSLSEEISSILDISRDSIDGTSTNLRDSFSNEAKNVSEMIRVLEEDLDGFHRGCDEIRRVGDRLGGLENDRSRLHVANELLVVVSELETDSLNDPSHKPATIEDEARAILPSSIRDADWYSICTKLQDLRVILADVSSPDVQRARENISVISEEIESRLLIKCEMVLSALESLYGELSTPGFWKNTMLTELLTEMRMYVKCLHCFNNGFAVRKRFLFVSLDYMQRKILHDMTDTRLVEHVSQLIHIIGEVCQKQFQLIRQIFPSDTCGRVCHLLLQRIFNDPAINLIGKVEMALTPQESRDLAETLDLLVIIRGKFTALQITLLHCATAEYIYDPEISVFVPRKNDSDGDDEGVASFVLLNEASCNELINDLIEQTLYHHLVMYFQNIIACVSKEYTALLARAMGNLNVFRTEAMLRSLISSTRIEPSSSSSQTAWKSRGGTHVPEIIPKNFANFTQIKSAFAQAGYVSSVLDITSDALRRLYGIGRGDRGLSERVREIFCCEVLFLSEFHLVPWMSAVELQLREMRRNLNFMSRSTPLSEAQFSQSYSGGKVATIGVEAIESIALWTKAYVQYESNFERVYMQNKGLSRSETEILFCREIHRTNFRSLSNSVKSIITSLAAAVCENISETLEILQSRHDFDATYEQSIGKPTLACTTVCSELQTFMRAMHDHEATLRLLHDGAVTKFIDAMSAGVTAAIISHFRTCPISRQGAAVLKNDLIHYQTTLQERGLEDASAMMADLIVISTLFKCSDGTIQSEIDDLTRIYDDAVVVVFAGCRVDSNGAWFQAIIDNKYAGNFPELPWDRSGSGVSRNEVHGPQSLRRHRSITNFRNSSILFKRITQQQTEKKSSSVTAPKESQIIVSKDSDTAATLSPPRSKVPGNSTKDKIKSFFGF